MLPALAIHPGLVTVVGPDGSETIESAANLPDWVKFARGPHGETLPVVLIARVRSGRGFTIRSYGPDGKLLAITASLDGSPTRPPEAVSGSF